LQFILTQFFELLNAEFRKKMGGASREQRADTAAELVTRLHAFMGEDSDASGSCSSEQGGSCSSEQDEKEPLD
jgi:hypothetical protein